MTFDVWQDPTKNLMFSCGSSDHDGHDDHDDDHDDDRFLKVLIQWGKHYSVLGTLVNGMGQMTMERTWSIEK